MFNFEKKKLMSAVSIDIKTYDGRITKLTEEMGELSGAILEGSLKDIIEESIDTLMIIVSIYIDLGGELNSLEDICYESFLNSNKHTNNLAIMYLEYSKQVGLMAESLQKYSQTPTSTYKGIINKSEMLLTSRDLAAYCASFIGSLTSDHELVNSIISIKNAKWFKNALKGLLQDNKLKNIVAKNGYKNLIDIIKENEINIEKYDIVYLNRDSKMSTSEYIDHYIYQRSDLNENIFFFIEDNYNGLIETLEKEINNFKYLVIS